MNVWVHSRLLYLIGRIRCWPPQVGHPNYFWNFIALGSPITLGSVVLEKLGSEVLALYPPGPTPTQAQGPAYLRHRLSHTILFLYYLPL